MIQHSTHYPIKRLFGRRKGRPLRARVSGLMDTLLPELTVPVPVDGARTDPWSLFGNRPEALALEVGFGGGEHLAAQAASFTTTGFIGCEPFVNGVAKLLTAIEAQGLKNVRIYPDDARDLLDALPDACLDAAFVLFPDPWPKKRHAGRRFIGQENLDRFARVLRAGGSLRLATDVPALAEWMRGQARAHPSFASVHDGANAPAGWISTRYEQKGRAAGRAPVYLVYRKVGD